MAILLLDGTCPAMQQGLPAIHWTHSLRSQLINSTSLPVLFWYLVACSFLVPAIAKYNGHLHASDSPLQI